METPNNVVLLYSKYSPNSKILMDTVRTSGIDFIFPLCVDNQDVRKRIKNSRFSISSVPCLLVVYPTGSVEKYEGNTAHSWMDSLLTRLRPPQKAVSFKQPHVEFEESVEEDSEDEGPAPPPLPKKKKARVPPKIKKHKSGREQTSINDLLDISENEEELDDGPSVFMENLEEIDPEKLGETVKKAVKSPQGTNLMQAAQQMQKMRETEDTKLPRPPVNSPKQ